MPSSYSALLEDLRRAIRQFKLEIERKAAGQAPLAPQGSLSLCEENARGALSLAATTDHAERARLVVDEAHALGWCPVRALRSAAALARDMGREEQSVAFEDEAARLPLDQKGA